MCAFTEILKVTNHKNEISSQAQFGSVCFYGDLESDEPQEWDFKSGIIRHWMLLPRSWRWRTTRVRFQVRQNSAVDAFTVILKVINHTWLWDSESDTIRQWMPLRNCRRWWTTQNWEMSSTLDTLRELVSGFVPLTRSIATKSTVLD